MAARKAFALRMDEKTLAAMQRWANDDLRSLNAQIEFVLRESLRQAGRLPRTTPADENGDVYLSRSLCRTGPRFRGDSLRVVARGWRCTEDSPVLRRTGSGRE